MNEAVSSQPAPALMAYAEKGRHAWWRYLAGTVLAVVIMIVLTVVIVVPFIVAGVKPAVLQSALSDPSHPVPFFISVGLQFATALVGFGAVAWWLHKKPPADYLGRWRWGLFALGLFGWLLVLLLDLVADYALVPAGFRLGEAPGALAFAVTCAGLAVQTFAEEFVFRGYFTQGLLKWLKRPWLTSIVSGVIFGLCHIPNGTFQALSAGLLGIALAWIAIRTGSLAFGYGVHLINNVFGALILVSDNDVFHGAPGFIVQNTKQLDLWDMGFVAVALLLIVLAFSRRGQRKS